MKLRFPLYAQIIFVFVCNMLMLYGIFLFSFCSRFNLEWESLIYAPVTDRVQFISMVIHRQLQDSRKTEWNGILQDFGKFYGVTFYIFDCEGEQLAGSKVKLPELVFKRVLNPHFGQVGEQFGPDKLWTKGAAFSKSEQRGLPELPFMTGRTEQMGPRGPFAGARPEQLGAAAEPFMLPRTEQMPPAPHFEGKPLPPPIDDKGAPRTPMFFMGPPGRFIVHTSNPDATWIGAPVPFSERSFGKPSTLIAMTSNVWQTKLVSDFGYILFVAVGLVGFSSIVWWPFIYMTTSSINKLTKTTEKIAEGKFDISLDLKRGDEIGRLAEAINVMAARLRMFVTGQKRFLGDIAHELCSPIARLQMATAILESNCSDQQQGTVSDIKEEIEQMSALINELLAFSKAGVLGPDIQLHAVDMSKLAENVCVRPEFSAKVTANIPTEQLIAQGDEVLLERAICNVLRNACRYAGDCGPIELSVYKKEKHICVKISDWGPGVRADTIELLGQPFYRPEPSRNRNFGGVGLGLAIVKTCIEACSGSLLLQNKQPSGLEVVITLEPVTDVAAQLN